MIVCALDVAYINAIDKNSNDCLNRSVRNIKRLPRLLFQVLSWADREGNPFGSDGVVRASAANVRLIARTKVEFHQCKFHAEIFSVSSMLKYLMQISWLGIEHRAGPGNLDGAVGGVSA